tara:strand:+ start:80 stop:700 length:621 start_codon:yes stop_codon:yes gene_type:complete
MKKIKNLVPFALLLLAITFNSCSNESEELDEVQLQNEKEILNTKDVKSFLDTYYNNTYVLSDKVRFGGNDILQKSGNTQDISVATVTSQAEPHKTGYVLTETNSGDLVYFGETDSIDESFLGLDFNTQDGNVGIIDIGGIGNPNIPITGEPGNTTLGWRYSYGSCRNGFRGVYRTYYFLGVRLSRAKPVQENGQNVTVGCNEEYNG